MHRALALARKGVGRTSPNPPVGCVIVRNGTVVGEEDGGTAGEPIRTWERAHGPAQEVTSPVVKRLQASAPKRTAQAACTARP